MLLDPLQAVGFLGASVLITLAPGPDNLMVISLGMARGRAAGMVFGLGCALGCLSHTALAAMGVSALIAASAWAFLSLKIVGGLYLAWLGLQALRSRGGLALAAPGEGRRPLAALFGKGLLANAINPKVVLFFLAFLPQFVKADRGDAAWQIIQLGSLFTLQAAVLFGAIGYFSGWIGDRLAGLANGGLWLDRLTGGLFILLGLRLLAS